ncbi:hypothetical protein L5515_017244 [Caenorhabditis briggsae]|uniref:Uncharacterized protein n=1 Tax=Caenorhabditis briggsae TaxID=6238 RepID=A0AAE9JSD8_CAEBR|nr:hypothetical protein L5515_017244 [Caenorhabditis briggsae]
MLIRTRWLELKEFRIVLDCLTKKTEYQLLNGICLQEILLDRQGFQYHQCCEIRDMDLLTNRNFLRLLELSHQVTMIIHLLLHRRESQMLAVLLTTQN